MLRSWRYCLPDSSHYMSWKSRDFVPGYSRCARYWLPAKSTIYATKQPKTDTYFLYFYLLIFFHPFNSQSVSVSLLSFFSNTDLSDSTDASLGGRYCLPDSSPFIIGNPETPSRVTLAMLGIGFQPNLPSIQLNHKTSNQSGTQYQASDNP